MENDLKESTINKVIKIVRENRNLPINDIKRIVKRKVSNIDSDEFYDILIKYNDVINNKKEKGER